MPDVRSRLARLERETERRVGDGEWFPSMQAIFRAVEASPHADSLDGLARRLSAPDTPARQREKIHHTLDTYLLEMLARVQRGQPYDDLPLDTTGLPAEWFTAFEGTRCVMPGGL